jgi:hypothetical protein
MSAFVKIPVLALAAVLPLSTATAGSVNMPEVITETYADYSITPPTPDVLIVCHGFGCQYRAEFDLTSADRARLAQILATGKASASAERRAIAAAGAWFDRRIGPLAGTQGHVARAGASYMDDKGQFDCIDASRNTTSLLLVLEDLKLLKYHDVSAPVARGFVLDGMITPHVTAVLTEKKTGEKWAVDAWTSGYGQAPEILPLTVWQTHS